jgi:hypothetical protein
VIPAGQDHKKLAIQSVHQAMFLIDAARPAAGQVFPQGLGFADASKGIPQAGLDQQVDAPQLSSVLALPVDDDWIKDSPSPFILSSLVYPSLVQPMSGPVHHIVGADVDRNELLAFNQQLKRDAIAKVDGDRMQSLQATPQWMQSQRRMVWIGFQQEQGFAVGLPHVGMASQKPRGSAVVPLGEDQRPHQGWVCVIGASSSGAVAKASRRFR